MKFLEKNLEEIIFDTDTDLLHSKGLDCIQIGSLKFRQLNLGNYGIADIVYFNKESNGFFTITILELKRDKIDIDSFSQVTRYFKGLKDYLDNSSLFYDEHFYYGLRWNIVLIGNTIDTYHESFVYYESLYSSLNVSISYYTYNYDFDGIKFVKETGYKLRNSLTSIHTSIPEELKSYINYLIKSKSHE